MFLLAGVGEHGHLVPALERGGSLGYHQFVAAGDQGDYRAAWQPEVADLRPGGALGAGQVDDDQVEVAFRHGRQLELEQGLRPPRRGEAEPAGEAAEGRALQPDRQQDGEEHQVEHFFAAGQPGGGGIGGQDDRHRPPQAGPGDEQLVPPPEAHARGTQPHRQRPGHEGQGQEQQDPLPPEVRPLLGEDQQAHHREHADVGHGEQRRGEVGHPLLVDERAVAHHVAGDEHRKHAAGPGQFGQPVDQQHDPEGKHVVVAAVLRGEAVEQPQRTARQQPAQRGGRRELPEEHQDGLRPRRLAMGERLDYGHSEHDGHRVVGGAFDLDGGGELGGQGLAAQDREDGGRIGGRNDGCQQQRLVGRPAQQPVEHGERAGRGEHHPPGGEATRRQGHRHEIGPLGGEAGVEEDQHQGEIADAVGEADVVEMPDVEDVAAEHDPTAQRDQDHRDAPAVQPHCRHYDGDQENRADEVDDIHGRCWLRWLGAAGRRPGRCRGPGAPWGWRRRAVLP